MEANKPTFDLLAHNVIGALDLLRGAHGNLLLGPFVSALAELLGRCHNGTKGVRKNFETFFDEYLSPIDRRYSDYKNIFWEDFRNGAAHSILPKGICILSFDARSEEGHLCHLQDSKEGTSHLWIYSDKFIKDLAKGIRSFIEKGESSEKIRANYISTFCEIKKESREVYKAAKNLPSPTIVNIEKDIKI